MLNISPENLSPFFTGTIDVVDPVLTQKSLSKDISNKNNTKKDTISFILSKGRSSLNSPEDTDLARRRDLEEVLIVLRGNSM